MYCQNCGTKIEENLNFCPNCGAKIDKTLNIIQKIQENPKELQDHQTKEIYASAWQRVGAYFIDFLILFAINMVVAFIMGIIFSIFNITYFPQSIFDIIGISINWLYFALQESSDKKATIGKRVLGLEVVDYEFKKISFLRATVRYFAQIISAAIFFIGYLIIFFTKKRQTLHDILTKTLVIRVK